MKADSRADVTWLTGAPARDTVDPARPCAVAGTVEVRAHALHAALLSFSHPCRTGRLLRRGFGPRQMLAYALWADTAAALGYRHVVDAAHRYLDELPVAPRAATATPTIAVALIVQDEAELLPRALASVTDFADEIVVVDGGSRDDTVSIARSFGAAVVERPFDDDFGAQRNAGLEHIRASWVFALDADEVLTSELATLLRTAAERGGFDAAFVPRLERIEGFRELERWPDVQLRFFRSGLRFKGRIHERVTGWRRPLHTSLSGPFLLHQKTALRFHRATLRYAALDPSRYTADRLAEIRGEVAQLERADHGTPRDV